MSYLESIDIKISTLESVLYKAVKDLDRLKSSHNALVKKPEYPDGTPGFFGDHKSFGYLKNLTVNKISRHADSELSEDSSLVKLYNAIDFTPLTTAILPIPVENTGTCPWKSGDEVRAEFENGLIRTSTNAKNCWNWTHNDGINRIVRTWLIKAAK